MMETTELSITTGLFGKSNAEFHLAVGRFTFAFHHGSYLNYFKQNEVFVMRH